MSKEPAVKTLEAVLQSALSQAALALSEFIDRKFQVSRLQLSRHDVEELPVLLGDEDEPVAAAFFQVRGELSGYLMLLMPISEAHTLLQWVLGKEQAGEDLADSALGEIGNVVGSSFLNRLADAYSLAAAPTPPQVIRDMIGALMNTLAAALAQANQPTVPVIRTEFMGEGESLHVYLLWLPESGQFDRLGQLEVRQ